MPKKGGRRKKRRTHIVAPPVGATVEGEDKIPKSFVFRNKKVGQFVNELILELRKMMAPHTALKLKEQKKNSIKDYLNVAGQLGVTHFLILSQTDNSVNFKIARTPQGPTLSFKILKYSLSRGVVSLQKRPYNPQNIYQNSPLVVLNNFAEATEDHVKLMRVTFQNMFPPINVQTVKLNDCRRVVLFNFNKEDSTVEIRHYSIRAVPTGVTKSIKRVVQAKLPNLGRLEDVSEFLFGNTGGGAVSDSEAEDESSQVILPQKYAGRGNIASQKSSIRLSELGPRMTVILQKVEKGLCEGDIMYHAYVSKTEQEAAELKKKKEEKEQTKKRRRTEQEQNVAKKKQAIEEKKKKKEEKKSLKEHQPQGEGNLDENASS